MDVVPKYNTEPELCLIMKLYAVCFNLLTQTSAACESCFSVWLHLQINLHAENSWNREANKAD